jgi:hypothetical protein
MGTILLIILVLLLLGAVPTWGWHSAGWGPSGGVGLLLVIVLILVLSGRL